jgi:hypothetical protein
MLGAVLSAAYRVDFWLAAKLGQPYRALLGIGLALEIVQHIREFPEAIASGRGLIRVVLSLLLFTALLLHQLGEFHERMTARRERRARRPRS